MQPSHEPRGLIGSRVAGTQYDQPCLPALRSEHLQQVIRGDEIRGVRLGHEHEAFVTSVPANVDDVVLVLC